VREGSISFNAQNRKKRGGKSNLIFELEPGKGKDFSDGSKTMLHNGKNYGRGDAKNQT